MRSSTVENIVYLTAPHLILLSFLHRHYLFAFPFALGGGLPVGTVLLIGETKPVSNLQLYRR